MKPALPKHKGTFNITRLSLEGRDVDGWRYILFPCALYFFFMKSEVLALIVPLNSRGWVKTSCSNKAEMMSTTGTREKTQ